MEAWRIMAVAALILSVACGCPCAAASEAATAPAVIDAGKVPPGQVLNAVAGSPVHVRYANSLLRIDAANDSQASAVFQPGLSLAGFSQPIIFKVDRGAVYVHAAPGVGNAAPDSFIVISDVAYVLPDAKRPARLVLQAIDAHNTLIKAVDGQVTFGLISEPARHYTLPERTQVLVNFENGNLSITPNYIQAPAEFPADMEQALASSSAAALPEEIQQQATVMPVTAPETAQSIGEPAAGEASAQQQAPDSGEIVIKSSTTVTFSQTKPAAGDSTFGDNSYSAPEMSASAGQSAPQASNSGPSPDETENKGDTAPVEVVEIYVEFDPSAFEAASGGADAIAVVQQVEGNGNNSDNQDEKETAPPAVPKIQAIYIGGVNVLKHSSGETLRIDADDLEDGKTLVLSGSFDDDSGIVRIEISLDGGVTWFKVNGTSDWEYGFTPKAGTPYQLVLRIVTSDMKSHDVEMCSVQKKTIEVPVEQPVKKEIELEEPPRLQTLEICGQPVRPGSQPPAFTRDDLDSRGLTIKGSFQNPGNAVVKVEVSTDGGATWNKAEGVDRWEYNHKPKGDEEIDLAVRYSTSGGQQIVDDLDGSMKANYTGTTKYEMLQDTLDSQMEAYMQEDVREFMQYVSNGFSSSVASLATTTLLESEIRNDFSNRAAVITPADMQYRVLSSEIMQDKKTARIVMEWNNSIDSKFRSTATLNYSWEGGEWKLCEFSGEPPFGTFDRLNKPGSITIELSANSVMADKISDVTLTARVLNELGDPLPGAEVTFRAVPSLVGTVESEKIVSDKAGYAKTSYAPSVTYTDSVTVTITAGIGTLSSSANLEIKAEGPPMPDDGDLN